LIITLGQKLGLSGVEDLSPGELIDYYYVLVEQYEKAEEANKHRR